MKKYYTDKTFLYEFIEENEREVKVKVVATIQVSSDAQKQTIGKIWSFKKEIFYKYALPYELKKPLMIKVNNGKCYCESCGKEMKLGDYCIRYNGMIFCCQGCFEYYLDFEEGNIDNSDLNDDEIIEVPMFDYKEGE